jgi:hypothetical protein
MGQRLTALVVVGSAMAHPARGSGSGKSPVQIMAMGYFESHPNASVDEFLTQSRPAPLGRADCEAVIATLPKEGERPAFIRAIAGMQWDRQADLKVRPT